MEPKPASTFEGTPEKNNKDRAVRKHKAAILEDLIAGMESHLQRGLPLQVDPEALQAAVKELKEVRAPPLTYKRLGHRLWQVVSTAAGMQPDPLIEGASCAATREMACELVELGMSCIGAWLPRDQCDLILQWAVTGKAWLDVENSAAAVRCLTRSTAVWEKYLEDVKQHPREEDIEAEGVAEASLQAQLWMASAFMKLENFDQAFIALSKAATILQRSPSLASISQGLVLRTCQGHAKTLMEQENHRNAADVLQLACKLMPNTSSKSLQQEKAEIKRRLASCFSELGEPAVAVANAREAVGLEAPGSGGHARSLRVLLDAFCRPGALAELESVGSEVQDTALQLILHTRIKLEDSLNVCRALADCGLMAACFTCLTRIRKRVRDNPEELSTAWLFGAQLLAVRIEESDGGIGEDGEVAADHLSLVLDEIEAAVHRPEHFVEKIAALLWNLGEALCRRGRPQAAVLWLQRALPFLCELNRTAAGWRALALCHQAAGGNESERARRCAETSLVHDPLNSDTAVILLNLALGRGDDEAVLGLLARTRCRPAGSGGQAVDGSCGEKFFYLDLHQVAHVAHIALQKSTPSSKARFSCLELLQLAVEGDPSTAKELGISITWVLRVLLETMEACDMGSANKAKALDDLMNSVSSDTEDFRWFIEFAWRQGVLEQSRQAWSSSAEMFAAAERLLASQRVEGRSWSLDEIRCAACVADAKLKEAMSIADTDAEKAALLRAEAKIKVEAVLVALEGAGSNESTASQLERFIRKLQLRLLLASGEAELDSHAAAELAAVAVETPSEAKQFAKLAWDSGNLHVANKCMETYLQLVGETEQKTDEEHKETLTSVTAAKRHLIETGSVEEFLSEVKAAYEALQSRTAGSVELDLFKEWLWLAIAAWNRGAEKMAVDNASAKAWLQASLDLLTALCSKCPEHAGADSITGDKLGSLRSRMVGYMASSRSGADKHLDVSSTSAALH